MSSIIATEDLRSIKTERALFTAMTSLLESHNFRKITVKGICEESLISRAAFYSHFVDKYDLLKHWINDVWLKLSDNGDTLNQLKQFFCPSANKNLKIIKNLLYESDTETFEVVFDFLLLVQNMTVDKNPNKDEYNKNVVLSNFYAGGIIWYLLWQIKNMFPSDVPVVNSYLCKMIEEFKNMQNK